MINATAVTHYMTLDNWSKVPQFSFVQKIITIFGNSVREGYIVFIHFNNMKLYKNFFNLAIWKNQPRLSDELMQ